MSEFDSIDVNNVEGAGTSRLSVASIRTYRRYSKSYRSFCLLRNDVAPQVKQFLEMWDPDQSIDIPADAKAILEDTLMKDWICALNKIAIQKKQKAKDAVHKARGYLAHEFVVHNLPPFLKPRIDKGKVSSWPNFDREWEKLQRTEEWKYAEPKRAKVANSLEEDRKIMNRGVDLSCYSATVQQYALNLNIEQGGRDGTLSRLDYNRSEFVELTENGFKKPVFRTAVVVSKATQLGLQITGSRSRFKRKCLSL